MICERVVYPTHCLKSSCRYVYAFDEGATRFFGCMAKVFAVELDLAPFRPRSPKDVYGALKAQRPPRTECLAEVERAYRTKYSWQQCLNPIFQHFPEEYSAEAIRLIVEGNQTPPEQREPAEPPLCPPEQKAGGPAD